MARHKNTVWKLEDVDDNKCLRDTSIKIALLMDLRDELQTLVKIFSCRNVQRGFAALERLARQNDVTFKRRVAAAVRKRLKRKGR